MFFFLSLSVPFKQLNARLEQKMKIENNEPRDGIVKKSLWIHAMLWIIGKFPFN